MGDKIIWVPNPPEDRPPTAAELEAGVDLSGAIDNSLIVFGQSEPSPWKGKVIKMRKVKPDFRPTINYEDCNDHEWDASRNGTVITENGVTSVEVRVCTKCRTLNLKLPASGTGEPF